MHSQFYVIFENFTCACVTNFCLLSFAWKKNLICFEASSSRFCGCSGTISWKPGGSGEALYCLSARLNWSKIQFGSQEELFRSLQKLLQEREAADPAPPLQAVHSVLLRLLCLLLLLVFLRWLLHSETSIPFTIALPISLRIPTTSSLCDK